MSDQKAKTVIGRAEKVDFPEQGLRGVSARIDTGAHTSALWASRIEEHDGVLTAVLFDEKSEHYTGNLLTFDAFEQIAVASSNGHITERYKVSIAVRLAGRRIRTQFTLADRNTQVYPVLIGRNTLRGKFVVDVKQGTVLVKQEKKRSDELQSNLRIKQAKE